MEDGGSAAGEVRVLNTGTSSSSCPSSQTTLASYTLPASTLEAGDVVEIRAVWKKTGTEGTASMKVLFGAQQVNNTHAINASQNFGQSSVEVYVNASGQRYLGRNVFADGTGDGAAGAATELLGGGIVISFTGEGCTGADSVGVDWFEILVRKHAN